jgi:hypothetical protein
LLDTNTNLNPTNQIFKSLMELQEGQHAEIFEKYFLAKKNRKLMECEAIRDKTVKDIEESKALINKI